MPSLYGSDVPAYLTRLDAANGLPSGMLSAVYALESNSGANPGYSSAGAQGPFQFMPATWAQYGNGGNIQDTGTAADAAGRYLRDLSNMFGGDTSATLAAYNWGPGNVRNAQNSQGSNWLASAPQETRDYVARGLDMLGGGAGQILGGGTGTQPSGQSASGTGAAGSSLDPRTWLPAIGSWLGGYASRAGLILLAVLLLAGGIYLIGVQTVHVESQKS